MTHDDLERDLRDMLARRASDIRTMPERARVAERDPADDTSGAAEVLELGPTRLDALRAARRRWPLLLAAAAVAAILAAVLTTLNAGAPDHRAPAGRHTSARVPVEQRTTCTITSPARWNAEVAAASRPLSGDAQSVNVVAATAGGALVVEYSRGDDPAGRIGDDLGVIAPGSDTVRRVGYFGVRTGSTPSSFQLDVDVDTTGDTAVVSYEVGGADQAASVRDVYDVDLGTGDRTLLTSAAQYPGARLGQGYAQDGIAYWSVDPVRAGQPTRVYARALDHGTPTVVSHGEVVELEESPAGVNWGDGATVDRPAAVPAVVRNAVDGHVFDLFDTVVSDGTAYAWQTESGALDWYSPSAGRVISFPDLLGRPGRTQASLFAVAGPLVTFQDRRGTSDLLLDTRTGALLRLSTSDNVFTLGVDGVAVGAPAYAGHPASGTDQLMRLHASVLSPLRC